MTMQNDSPMRVSMVGVGNFGGYRRARMRETGLFQLVAAYDLNRETLDRCCEEDGATPVDSFEQLLDTPDVEAMIISTGAKFHAGQALAALEQGLHIFVEKPLCSTPEEMRALLTLQQQTGLVVGVGHNDHSSNRTSLHLKRLIDEGAFGTLATFEKVTAHSGGLEIKPGQWRGDPKKNPGGMLFQCGCHALHELMFYFGPIASVSCMMRYDVHTTQTADVAHCLLHFQSGLIGTLSAYHVTPYRHTFNLYGTHMNLYQDARAPGYGDPREVLVQYRKKNEAEPHVPFTLDEGGDPCGNLRSFYSAVRDGGEPYPSLKDGARAVAVIFAAEEAARTGTSVPVEMIE
ncbi:MAG: Gfo/Idh/MocA family protein [Armatimonadota bacterium]